MVPNHIMQFITLTAMEPPISFEANAVRDEQAKILHAIQPFTDEDVLSKTVRGQYGEGIMNGQRVPAYRSEQDVPPDSRTDTYVAMRVMIDNWRWAGVPFYLRTGKRMPNRTTQVVIQFRRAPFMLFRETQVGHMMPNQMVLHIPVSYTHLDVYKRQTSTCPISPTTKMCPPVSQPMAGMSSTSLMPTMWLRWPTPMITRSA